MKRSIALVGTGLPDLELAKVTQINTNASGRIYLEQMKDKRWRLEYTTSAIPVIEKLQALVIKRKGKTDLETVVLELLEYCSITKNCQLCGLVIEKEGHCEGAFCDTLTKLLAGENEQCG